MLRHITISLAMHRLPAQYSFAACTLHTPSNTSSPYTSSFPSFHIRSTASPLPPSSLSLAPSTPLPPFSAALPASASLPLFSPDTPDDRKTIPLRRRQPLVHFMFPSSATLRPLRLPRRVPVPFPFFPSAFACFPPSLTPLRPPPDVVARPACLSFSLILPHILTYRENSARPSPRVPLPSPFPASCLSSRSPPPLPPSPPI